MTLKIGPTQDTGKELEEVIGKPLHDPWAWFIFQTLYLTIINVVNV
jgi:hypothetical protein